MIEYEVFLTEIYKPMYIKYKSVNDVSLILNCVMISTSNRSNFIQIVVWNEGKRKQIEKP